MGARTVPEIDRRLRSRGFRPHHVVEVGVWRPETSNVAGFIEDGVRTTLVEPDPDSVAAILRRWGDRPQVVVHPVAVYRRPGRLTLARRGASTFVTDVEAAPAIVNDGYRPLPGDLVEVDAVTFDTLDDGSFDLLCIDIEGCEWYVLERLRSRPRVLSVETHGARYVNPHLERILAWARENGYDEWYRNDSDTVFVRRGTFAITPADRLRLFWNRVRLGARRLRKRIAHRLRRKPSR